MKKLISELREAKSSIGKINAYNKIDADRAKRKAELLAALDSLVKQEIEQDPSFYLTVPALDKLIKKNPTLFPGIRTANSFLPYWGNSIAYVREKLDSLSSPDNNNSKQSD